MVEIKKIVKRKPLGGFEEPPKPEETQGNLSAPETAPAAPIKEAKEESFGFNTQFNTKVPASFKSDFNDLWKLLNRTRSASEPKIIKGTILIEALEVYKNHLRKQKRI